MAVVSIVSLLSASAQAEPKLDERPIRVYFGAGALFQGLSGDFNKDSYLTDGNESLIVPEVDQAMGFGIHAGFRRQSSRSVDPGLEVGYAWSKNDATWAGRSWDTELRVVNLTSKLFF